VEANFDGLRAYLQGGIVSGDVEAVQWIDTRHIQPPSYLPFQGVQQSVSGYQGGQWAGGDEARLTMASKNLTSQGRETNNSVIYVPNSSFQLDIRKPGTLLFHYWWEWECGRDQTTAAYQPSIETRKVWLMPFVGNKDAGVASYASKAQETRNHAFGLQTTPPLGSNGTYPQGGGYDAKQGTLLYDASSVGSVTFGLVTHSQIDRVGIVNWGVALEFWCV